VCRVSAPRPGEPSSWSETQGLIDFGRGLAGQAENAQGEGAVETGELLDFGVARPSRAEGGQGAAVVLVAIADEAQVVAEPIHGGIDPGHLLEEGLGPVVFLLTDVGEGELEGDRRIGRRAGPSAFQEGDGLCDMALGHVYDARVVQRLHVVRLNLQRVPQVLEGCIVLLVVEIEDGLSHVDIGYARLGDSPGNANL